MRRVILLTAILAGLLAWPAAAGAILVPVNDPIYEYAFSGPGVAADCFQSVVTGASGQLYVCGTMNSATHGIDAYVRRLSDTHPWAARYDGAAHVDETSAFIVACPTGGVYLACSSMNGAGDTDIVVARYGPGGKRLWAHRWAGPGGVNDNANLIGADSKGNVYAVGWSRGGAVILKYRPNGSRAWLREYRPAGKWVTTLAMRVTSSGLLYLAGTISPTGSASDGLLVKYSAAGRRLWVRMPNSTPGLDERLTAVCPSPNGGVYAVGSTGVGTGDADAVIYRYNAYGNQRLAERYGAGDGRNEWFDACALDSHGRVAVCGTWGDGFAGSQFWVALLTPSGAISWQAIDGTTKEDHADLLVVDGTDRITAVGTFRNATDTAEIMHVVAFTAAGVPRWASRSESALGSVQPLGIARRGSTNLFVCGERALGGADWEGFVLGWNLATP